MADATAVFFRREPSSHPFPRVDTQPIALNTRLAFVLAILSTIRDLKALFEEQVCLRLSRARVSLKKVVVLDRAITAMYRQMARLLVKVLRGTAPADLPVEQAATFELAFNLKTATAIGLVVPPSLLLRADKVIE